MFTELSLFLGAICYNSINKKEKGIFNMAYLGSMRSVARMVEATSKRNEEIGNKKNAEHSWERFECAADAYSIVFVVCGVIMALR